MIIDGSGMIARAFLQAQAPDDPPGYVFARGVARSDVVDEREYLREKALLEAASDTARASGVPVVYFTGAPIYGAFSATAEGTPAVPHSRYGVHQAQCESQLLESGAIVLIERLPNIVGPSANEHQLIPALTRQILDGRVRVQKSARRDLLDVSDLVAITRRLLSADRRHHVYNVASGRPVPVRDIVEHIRSIVGASPTVVEVDGGTDQSFDLGRLTEAGCALDADDGYWARVLDRYVPQIISELEAR
jgi:nucleoside-diphosphate-sugar epimerase